MASAVRRTFNNLHWFIDTTEHRREARNSRAARRLVLEAIESGGNNFLIVAVAGMGFFTDSYLLFASNAITPMISYVYWNNETTPDLGNTVNFSTLGGCVFGMLLFGLLSDLYGRRKVYGHELLLLIVGTIGVLMSSPGYSPSYSEENTHSVDWSSYGSMNVISWLTVWRFVSGCGLGGDYPLSATIVSEMAPTKRRARMLAATFSFQAIGYATASIVALVVTTIVSKRHPEPSQRAVDQIWRWVIGLSLIPASLAVFLRLTIPESPRFTLDVTDNITKAFEETNRFNQANLKPAWVKQANLNAVGSALHGEPASFGRTSSLPVPTQHEEEIDVIDIIDIDQSRIRAKEYFLKQGNWIILLGTASCWFWLDIGFFALSLYWPQTVQKLWYQLDDGDGTRRRIWDTCVDQDPEMIKNGHQDCIYNILITNSTHSLIISSIGALLGALPMIYFIEKVSRKKFQFAMFLVLAILFIVTGATFSKTVLTGYHGVTITLFILCQLAFYLGPNTTTFVIAAELQPTKWRARCAGASAAAGKVGSIITQVFLAYVKFEDRGRQLTNLDPQSNWLGWVLMIFSLPMVFGAISTWFLIPELQDKNHKSKKLEELVFVRQQRKTRNQDVEMRNSTERRTSMGRRSSTESVNDESDENDRSII